jgi:hypothetical protein
MFQKLTLAAALIALTACQTTGSTPERSVQEEQEYLLVQVCYGRMLGVAESVQMAKNMRLTSKDCQDIFAKWDAKHEKGPEGTFYCYNDKIGHVYGAKESEEDECRDGYHPVTYGTFKRVRGI